VLDVGAMSHADILNNGPVIMAMPDCGFGENGFGTFAGAVFRQATAGVSDPRLTLMAAAGDPTQRSGIASDGGFLIPSMFSKQIWDGVSAADGSGDTIISSCDQMILPFGVSSVEIPAIVNTTRANGGRNGGLQGFWKDELTQMTATKAEVRMVELRPHDLYVFAFISDDLLKNDSLMEQWIVNKAPEEIRFKMANAIISGTGGAQPTGIRGHAGTIDQAKTDGQIADTITATNIRKMWSRVLAASRFRGRWYSDLSTEEQVAQFTQAVGTGGVPLMTPDGGLSVSPFTTLLGRPIVASEFAYELGDSGDLFFADFSNYMLVLRGGIESAVSMHLKFDFNQTAFRFIFGVDGQPMADSPITPFTPGGTTKTSTLSSFVTLAERA
jgi:HK97 family phage major capsid protein